MRKHGLIVRLKTAYRLFRLKHIQVMQCNICNSMNIKRINSFESKDHLYYKGMYVCLKCGSIVDERQFWQSVDES